MVVALNDSSKSGISSSITLNHFKLLKQVGQGDIGNVYLTQLKGSQCMFAMKVFDKKALMQREKLQRMQNEREILKHLRHPFLPTVYAQFEAEDYSCLVMDYCSGGDLHSLRLKQHGNRFGLRAARFYAAEVLVALEYLHMMGIIYRDLKPENVLVREDGHIMLTDFDLSITCDMKPKVIYRSSCPSRRKKKKAIGSLNSWLYCCSKPLMQEQLTFPEVIIEPREACAMSFVGTHEYLAPEIIKGSGHGSPVDWWAFGIFVYELLFGRTPFKGKDIESTLMNVIQQPLRFPEEADLEVGEAAKGLIRELLRKDPRKRLGAIKGAAEIKQHGFFKGINWALLRSAPAPHIPLDGDNTSPKFQPLSYLEYF